MPVSPADAAGQALDTRAALQLGEVLLAFLARAGDEPELDDFGVEDAGVLLRAGFTDLPTSLTRTWGRCSNGSTSSPGRAPRRRLAAVTTQGPDQVVGALRSRREG